MNRDDINPEVDLLLERVVEVPRELVWQAWTRPEHVVHWFTPAPFTTTECQIDLRPGGVFRTVMRSPDGEEFANVGCYLEIVEPELLVWTTALAPGYRPVGGDGDLRLTAFIELESTAGGTRYTALARHGDAAMRERHAEMGFAEGWGTALEQLVAFTRSLGVSR